jgi:hypothetical protein
MTYTTGGIIQASDYNIFSTLTSGMNEIFADLHSGATTTGALADFGYGQSPAISAVSASNTVTASQWGTLFDTMRDCGTHQGTTVVPPLPVSNPVSGSIISVYNTPSTLSTLISTLRTNRHIMALGQSTLVVGSNFTQPGATIPWTNTLTFNYRVDFGNWNNARYFFNSGGSLLLNGSYSPIVTPDDVIWDSILTTMSPVSINWNSTSPGAGTGGTSIGFYDLTTSYQTIYTRAYGGSGSYSNSYVQLQSKLTNSAGTDGQIDFSVVLVDLDSTPPIPTKSGVTVYRVDNIHASGAIVYPGPSVIVSAVGANNGFIAT